MSVNTANTPPREIEFKFAVSDGEAFQRLIDYLEMPADLLEGGIVQINHFFDTADQALRSQGAIVRLREQNGAYRLTLKQSATAESGTRALSDRIEYETPIPPARARGFLENRSLPLAGLIQAFASQSRAIARLLEDCRADQDLRYTGHFKNTRRALPVTLAVDGKPYRLIMEFDTSEFPGLAPRYEIEVEIPSHDNAKSLQHALVQLLDNAGVNWWTTTNKAARFFAALDTRGRGRDDMEPSG